MASVGDSTFLSSLQLRSEVEVCTKVRLAVSELKHD